MGSGGEPNFSQFVNCKFCQIVFEENLLGREGGQPPCREEPPDSRL